MLGTLPIRLPRGIAKELLAEEIVEALPKDSTSVPSVELFLPELLKDATFVGHLVTDLDSVAGAIGAAELYGGTAALASVSSQLFYRDTVLEKSSVLAFFVHFLFKYSEVSQFFFLPCL